ncbi:MAG: SiaB family protein kinase [Bacteroidales bacterium]|nr:SiaB family protein kinase [Bacteroidales bacterium]MBN2758006.1 SiaB family protein kinase [Bacteroidales bacterium]
MSKEQVDNQKIEFLEDFYEMLSKEVLIAYRGTFEKNVLSVLAKNIETSVDNSSVLKRKFFKIFLELAQNISLFSVEQIKTQDGEKSGAGLFIIKHSIESYYFISGNIILNSDIEKLNSKIEYINTLDREKMRLFRRKQYEFSEPEKDSSIGLVKIALASGKKIEITTKTIDSKTSFVIISVEVAKEL